MRTELNGCANNVNVVKISLPSKIGWQFPTFLKKYSFIFFILYSSHHIVFVHLLAWFNHHFTCGLVCFDFIITKSSASLVIALHHK
jgi:hypothetical protein